MNRKNGFVKIGNNGFAGCFRNVEPDDAEMQIEELGGVRLAASGREPLHHVRKAVRSQRLRTDGGYRHHVQRSAEGLGSGDHHL